MLSYSELQQLEELKKQFLKTLGVINYEFTEEELKTIFQKIEKYPKEKRTIALWQQIIKEKTRVSRFLICEALDLSDINHIHQQIQNLLNRK